MGDLVVAFWAGVLVGLIGMWMMLGLVLWRSRK